MALAYNPRPEKRQDAKTPRRRLIVGSFVAINCGVGSREPALERREERGERKFDQNDYALFYDRRFPLPPSSLLRVGQVAASGSVEACDRYIMRWMDDGQGLRIGQDILIEPSGRGQNSCHLKIFHDASDKVNSRIKALDLITEQCGNRCSLLR